MNEVTAKIVMMNKQLIIMMFEKTSDFVYTYFKKRSKNDDLFGKL